MNLLHSIPLDVVEIEDESLVQLRPRNLNSVLGRIILPHQVSLLHGPDRAPLTLVAHALAAGAVLDGGRCLFLDSSGNYNPVLMRAMLGEISIEHVDRIIVGPLFGLVDLIEAIKAASTIDGLRVIVVDSLTGVLNMTGDAGSKERQRRLFGALQGLRASVNKNRIHVMLTDYSHNDWRTGEHRVVGGNVLEHSIDSSVYCSAIRRIEDGIILSVERSPVFPPPTSVAVKLGFRGPRSLNRR